MVFSSIPAYLDPANWQQHQNHQIIGSSSTNPLLSQPPPPPPPPSSAQPHASGGTGSIRPGSMSERARLANIPMPEAALKCPRCESTNTKFCYFNNYSLSQPRHFCKACRRYWTRGGALRSVPVGGGCRRNKRSKPTSSKSPAPPNNTTTNSTTTTGPANISGINSQFPPQFLTDNYSNGDISLNYSGVSAPISEMNFQMGNNNFLGGGSGGIEQWRFHQQYPFLGSMDPSPAGLYHFEGGDDQPRFAGETSQAARPKLAASWTDLSCFSSTSTNNPL